MATAGIDFFRIDRSGSVRKLLIVAGILIAIGVTLIGSHLMSRLAPDFAHAVSLAGGLTVATGLILGFGSMAMILMENVYILLEEEGIVFHENGKELKLPWADLEGVSVESADPTILVFKRAKDKPHRWFAGKSAKTIHAKVEEAKRKADHGLLKFESSMKSTPPSKPPASPRKKDESDS